MLGRYCGGDVPAVATDAALRGGLRQPLRAHRRAASSAASISAALEEIWQRVRRLNRYVEERAPWVPAREEGRREELDAVLASLAEGLRVVTVALSPYMPAKTATLLEALGAAAATERAFAARGSGASTTAIAPLFPKAA